MSDRAASPSPTGLRARCVRYAELRPCTTAFIDTRTPGSAAKENFTIIGPGVSESPDQFVHIDEPHGFNIGGARQPPGCTNSQHSHETAEVFVVHSGRWAFYLGEHADDARIELAAGDTISIPVHVFRGFENVGGEIGFLFAVLGGDDPGRVLWAPYVFEQARRHGLILLDNGSLVDTTRGEQVPPGRAPMPVTTQADVARLRRMSGEELATCVMRADESNAGAPCAWRPAGWREHPIIGAASPDESLAAGKMRWPHGFHLRRLDIEAGTECPWHRRSEAEVILMHAGRLRASVDGESVELGPGDVLTVPIGAARRLSSAGDGAATAFVVRGGDAPTAPQLVATG